MRRGPCCARRQRQRWLPALLGAGLVAAACAPSENRSVDDGDEANPDAISAFGVYEGFDDRSFSEWVRTSQYVAVRDGTKLAIDVVRPAVDGEAVAEPQPVVMTLQRYGRSHIMPGREGISTPVETTSYIRSLVEHGYVYVSVGLRGSGASFGSTQGVHPLSEATDAYDVAAWIVAQPWSDGSIGMMGNSYRANAALMAISAPHPAVKAIFPSMMDFDNYLTARPGGVMLVGALSSWRAVTGMLDGNIEPPPDLPVPKVAPVDGDDGEVLYARARAEHRANGDPFARTAARRFRDQYSYSAIANDDENMLAGMLPGINEARVPVYLWSGWQDIWPKSPFLWMANLEGPRRLAIGPWSHDPDERDEMRKTLPGEAQRSRLQAIEMRRWFDHWLRGVDNGVTNEPRYVYAVLYPDGSWEWRESDSWPVTADNHSYYFSKSASTGVLSVSAPSADGADELAVDFTATTGPRSRWIDATSFFPMDYSGFAENTDRGLTYLSEPATAPLSIVGHPVVTLYITATTPDVDVFVYLEWVRENGTSTYLTEGVLRASHRTLGRAPYDNLGLPWPTHARSDVAQTDPLSGNVARLEFDLAPISHRFERGDRFRITITGADKDNFELYQAEQSPRLTLMRSAEYPSRISLPVLMETK